MRDVGRLALILLVSALLSSIAALIVARRYRTVMRRLMRAQVRASATEGWSASPGPLVDAEFPPPRWVPLAMNRRKGMGLALLLVGLSCLISASGALLLERLLTPDAPLAPKRTAVIAFMQLWPVVPALGLLWRWSRWRVVGTLALWAMLCIAIVLWRSVGSGTMALLGGVAALTIPPMLIVALLCMGNATRAIAPWLILPIVFLVWASMTGIDVLGAMIDTRSPLLGWILGWAGVNMTFLLFAVLPWLLAWWPLRRLARALGRAYTRKHLSELLVLFTTVWGVALLFGAFIAASSAGFAALAMLLPLLWVPPVVWLYASLQPAPPHPPTLLVLRVFQRDAHVQALFDGIIERWRLTGNTVMIAGTDLADRTLDAEDIFTFLDGGLAGRFISTPAGVAPRLAAFDMAPDADGRYRVNECYCHDTTWKEALQALVQRSDVALMDLRGFQRTNEGCVHELGALAQASRALRVVLLADGDTDRRAAAAAIGESRAARFTWVDAPTIDARKRREVLENIFAHSPTSELPR